MKKISNGLFALALCLISNYAYAHKVGNGGDYLRGTFISMGDVVLKYLNETTEGQKIIQVNTLNLSDLETTLDINRITVTEDILKDNTGSIVDALGVPSLITINNTAWFEHFQNARDVYYLVFHEMLRSAAINDDNYIISGALKNFPLSMRVETRVAPKIPLMEQDRLTGIFNSHSITVGGSGCKNSDQQLITELNEEKNIFQISMKNYQTNVGKGKETDVKSCSVAIPVKVPSKKRVVISLIDLNGDFDLYSGTLAKVSFEAFLSGGHQKSVEKNLGAGHTQANSFLMRKSDVLKSSCGGSDIMRVNSNLMSRSTSEKSQFVAVKSIYLYLSLEDCK